MELIRLPEISQEACVSIKVTIIITNYNYGRYIRDAIDSALGLRHDNKEVIVCDDGSTDNSREIILSYGSKLITIFKPNCGQPSAANAAFDQARGDIVFFLDSDDVLLPDAAEKVLAVWNDDVSRVQFPMLICDSDGRRTGTMFPNFTRAFTPKEVRERMLNKGGYPASPTTGAASSRKFLANIFPVPEKATGIDSFTIVAAPLYGDVITLLTPLALYRVHDSNSWAQSQFVPEKLAFYLKQDVARTAYLHEIVDKLGLRLAYSDPLVRDVRHMMTRLACKRIVPDVYPIPGDTWRKLMTNALNAALRHEAGFFHRAILVAWICGVAYGPTSFALYLVKLRFTPSSRPKHMIKMMQFFGLLKRVQEGSA
jgi:glycosyltransferase involved in cell wall biosynthesis